MAAESDSFPPGYVRFSEARRSVPEPAQRQVSDEVTLGTLHIPGPDPPLVFVHGGLGSLWNPSTASRVRWRTRADNVFVGGQRRLLDTTDAIHRRPRDRSPKPARRTGRRPTDHHGHSYGTAIAIEYAKQHSTSALVLHGGGDHDLTLTWEKALLNSEDVRIR
jgi:pimeloyl-ACP methyl ester carboxylesterase